MARNTNTAPAAPAYVADIEAAKVAYADATGAAKAKVRRDAEASAMTALGAGDFDAAKAWHEAVSQMVPTKPTAEAPDYAALTQGLVDDLLAAAALIASGHARPAGVPDDADLSGVTVPGVDDVTVLAWRTDPTDRAVSLASAKVARTTVRNSIADVIARAISGRESGTFLTVAEIRSAGATEDYTPSDGAIAARLFPASGRCTVPGVVPVEATATNARGIRVA